MNSLERILAAARLEPTDCVPFAPQLFGHAAVTGGAALSAYLRDGRVLAECQLKERQRYGTDAVFAFMDLGVEVEALGARLDYHESRYPDVAGGLLAPADDGSALRQCDPARDGRLPELLRAVGLLRAAVGDTALVAGAVAGPMTLATQLYGIETALYCAADDPVRYEAVLDFATETVLRSGAAQLAAGAHGIVVFDPAASPAVVPADFFRARLESRLRRLADGLRAAGARLIWLNIAGPTADILPRYAAIGADIATFDYYLDPTEARRLLPHACLAGNLKSLDFLDRAPVTVTARVQSLFAAFADRGGFVLSSGCEIPPEADADNLAALAAAAGAG